MKYLKSFVMFEGIDDILRREKPRVEKESDIIKIGKLKRNVEIRIDVDALGHVIYNRNYRHDEEITKEEIVETIEKAIEQVTISLMQDEFDIYQNEDNYPTQGVRAGEPNRFVIKNLETNLNVVCHLEAGQEEFTLTVITVMVKPNKKDQRPFKAYRGQYVVEVGDGKARSYISR